MNEEIDFYASLTKSINSIKSSDSNRSSMRSKKSESKICQVYSEFIQSNITNDDGIQKKKPKLAEPSLFVNQTEMKDPERKDTDLLNSFIGINSFESENLFAGLANYGLLIVCLESNSDFSIKNFTFKGRCSINLLCGCIQINGFKINCSQDKWYDLFSPESNSYLTISNIQEDNSNFIQSYEQILSKIQIISQINIDNLVEENIRNFLIKSNFDNQNSSLIAIRPLKSQPCNYICNFQNFQNIYQTSKESNELLNQLFNKFGIFPIPCQNFNAIHYERDNEKNIVQQILTGNEANSEGKKITILLLKSKKYKL